MRSLSLIPIIGMIASLTYRTPLPQPELSPDLSAIQRETGLLVAERSTHWCTWFNMGGPVPSLPRVETYAMRRVDSLLTNIPLNLGRANPLKNNPVYLVHAIARSGWWKTETEHVLLLQRQQSGWRSLFHYDGGWYGKGIDFDIIDLGTSSHQFALMIQDYACGNTMSQTLTYIYRYDRAAGQFVEVYDELTRWLPSATPMVYRSTLGFEGSDAALKDIVVCTQLIDQWNNYAETPCEARFSWDGTKYQGKMNLPEDLQQDVNKYLEHFPR
ncbi:MAG: hypothetical protein JW993_02860 [Sedimentisphaerales bacterium]|nr:hypothetical protein [Sedimentisphaerales bacterium]